MTNALTHKHMIVFYYHLVIDASQSMRSYWDGIARTGQSHTRRLLKKYQGDTLKQIHISYSFFNDLFMAGTAPVTNETHCRQAFGRVCPSGGTALYDALGEGIRIMQGMSVARHDRMLLAGIKRSRMLFMILIPRCRFLCSFFSRQKN